MESGREKIRDRHKEQYLFLMSFLLKYQRLYVDYLHGQHIEKKRTTPVHRMKALEEAHEKRLHDCGFHLVATSMEVTCVFQVIQNIRHAQDAKVK